MSKKQASLIAFILLVIIVPIVQDIANPSVKLFALTQSTKSLSNAARSFSPAEFASRGSLLRNLYDSDPDAASGITPNQYRAAATLIQSFGYDCPKANLMNNFFGTSGYYVWCNGGQYKFEIQNHGGKWTVTSDD